MSPVFRWERTAPLLSNGTEVQPDRAPQRGILGRNCGPGFVFADDECDSKGC
ncbi:uncharacterized protein GLRG_02666 [Colletotrichum graminicola M1.001]|uniref:Uncharacterized protein n=1 Tax=Colletotrichum graminicola (strain M1.001 / M2 / FGSC 10212) TaxID=645133 RepID=E3Q7K8_COLGM|nr:uncharacterized protein GLRG_02666 [Colletotrichum graminicola M1.001]EFQ26846.1 hypothetical protein GLRG_02666 [Colletotrichum graminicola M1.001]